MLLLRWWIICSVACFINFTDMERHAYQESLKYYRDMKNVVDTSKEEGIEEGIEQGLERGLAQRTLEIARKMKHNNEPTGRIMQYTGLSEEEVEDLDSEYP